MGQLLLESVFLCRMWTLLHNKSWINDHRNSYYVDRNSKLMMWFYSMWKMLLFITYEAIFKHYLYKVAWFQLFEDFYYN